MDRRRRWTQEMDAQDGQHKQDAGDRQTQTKRTDAQDGQTQETDAQDGQTQEMDRRRRWAQTQEMDRRRRDAGDGRRRRRWTHEMDERHNTLKGVRRLKELGELKEGKGSRRVRGKGEGNELTSRRGEVKRRDRRGEVNE